MWQTPLPVEYGRPGPFLSGGPEEPCQKLVKAHDTGIKVQAGQADSLNVLGILSFSIGLFCEKSFILQQTLAVLSPRTDLKI